MKNDKTYLLHMRDAIKQIREYTKDVSSQDFIANRMMQDAVVREIEIVGEAAKNLSQEFRSSHKQVPWTRIAGMRDKLIHGYFGVDLKAVWDTVKKDLPEFSTQVDGILKEFGE